MASDEYPTNTILHSLDEGLTWKEYEFSKESIEITNIIIEPNNTASNFIIIGELHSQGIIISLDFQNIYDSIC